MKFVLFTDNLSDLSIAEASAGARRAGFDGVDLTVRPGGHVLPEHVGTGLPEARRAVEAAGGSIPMISTALTDDDSPHAEESFAAAAHAGVRFLKLGYWPYQPFGTLAAQLDAARVKLRRLVQLGRKYAVLPCVHCHSGRLIAAGGAQLYLLLREFSPGEVGAYVDPMHMSMEGGLAGWEMGLDLLAPWLALVGVKDFRWSSSTRDASQRPRWQWQYCPLGEGQAHLPEFFAYLKRLSYDGVVSLHSEYKGESSYRRLATPELLRQSAADLRYVKSLLEA